MVGGGAGAEARVAAAGARQLEAFRPVTSILRSRAEEQGQNLSHTFLNDSVEPERHLSYAELYGRARAIATVLGSRGLRGEPVLLLYPPGLDFLIGFFGCLYAGAIAVPAYPPRPRRVDARIRDITADSGARLALTTRDALDRLGEAAGPGGGEGLEWLATDEIGTAATNGSSELEPDEHDVAYLQYTSGSTSAPKGVMISHGNVWDNLSAIDFQARPVGPSAPSVGVTWLPHFHDMGLVFGLLLPIHSGFPCHVMAPASFLQHPERWLEAISAHRATHSGAPNFAYDLCVRKVAPGTRSKLELGSWRVAVNGAEPVRAGTIERFVDAFGPSGFRRRTFCPAFGLAESTLMVTSVPAHAEARTAWFVSQSLASARAETAEPGAPGSTELVGCGVPSLGLEVAIVNPVTGARGGESEVGEVWVRGESVGKGYWKRPQETGEVFHGALRGERGGPFLRTGDLGFLHEGELFVTGRVKDVIIIRGRNHYPHDIEATVERAHPALRPSSGAAFSVDVDGEERLAIVQEVERSRRRDDMEQVLSAIRRAVTESHEISPYAVVLLNPNRIPKTSSGKIQRKNCRSRFLSNELEPIAEWRERPRSDTTRSEDVPADAFDRTRSRDEVERFIVERLGARATGAGVDVDEPFASYGLDSADALELIAELESFTGRKISPIVFWNYPTTTSLAGYLSGEDETATG